MEGSGAASMTRAEVDARRRGCECGHACGGATRRCDGLGSGGCSDCDRRFAEQCGEAITMCSDEVGETRCAAHLGRCERLEGAWQAIRHQGLRPWRECLSQLRTRCG